MNSFSMQMPEQSLFMTGLGAMGALITLINIAIFIFLVVLAWRATKALEATAKAQDQTAYLLRELVVLKSKEEKKS